LFFGVCDFPQRKVYVFGGTLFRHFVR
jgi:hypothetical protein